MKFGEFLVKKGLITRADLDIALNLTQIKFIFGVLSVREKYLDMDALTDLLEEQKTMKPHQKIGQIAVSKGLMTEEQVEKILTIQRESVEFLGEILVDMRLVDNEELQKQLEAYRAEYGDHSPA